MESWVELRDGVMGGVKGWSQGVESRGWSYGIELEMG